MKIPVDKLTRAFKMGASVKKDSDTPVRVSVYLDSSASRFLAETVRDAFVPQTTRKAKTKSVWNSGRKPPADCVAWPKPLPKKPPEPTAISERCSSST